MNKKFSFNNGALKIMQVSDPQDLSFENHTMKAMLNKVYDREKPDLVVFTGDNILGNHLRDARFGNRHTVKTDAGEMRRLMKAIDNIIAPLEKRDIPFVFIFGNHDDMNCVTKEQQLEIYKSYPNCIMPDNDQSVFEAGTCYLPIYASDMQHEAFRLWLFDSAWYDKAKDKCYSYVKEEAVNWYREENRKLRNDGSAPMPSLFFIHIPLPEQTQLLQACPQGVGGVLNHQKYHETKEKEYYRLDPAKCSGELGEYPCVLERNTGLFDAIKEDSNVLAVVSGHDHTNCFDGIFDGVRFIQTSCASLRCYGIRNRGVRIFELNEREPSVFRTKHLTYEDIMGNGFWSNLRYLLDADGLQKQKYSLLAAAGIITVGAVSCFLSKSLKHYK